MLKYKKFFNELPTYKHTHNISNKIFWCWLQGMKEAPPITKACLNSIKRNCKKHEIIIITKNNMNQYVHFPDYILKKFKNNIIPTTQFSDLLRLELLLKYGGTWIDSTVLITKYDKTFFKKDLFFFQYQESYYLDLSNWFLTSERESPIMRTTLDLLYEYWAKNNNLDYYFIFHIFFKMALMKYENEYNHVPYYSNIPPHILQANLLKRFNDKIYKNILRNSSIHKLTRKIILNKSKGLFFHYILTKFKYI